MIREDSRHLERSTRRTAARSSVAVWLVRHGWPRLAVAGMVATSAAAGFGASQVLHDVGVTAMWVRYPLCVAAGYAVFLGMLGLCVRRAAHRITRHVERVRHDSARRQFRRNDHAPPQPLDEFLGDCLESAQHGDGGGDARASLLAVLGLTVVLICGYYIFTAPTLLSQVLVEGALVTALYRPTTRGPNTNWLTVALEETVLPAVMIALCLTVIGVVLRITAPEATNLVEVWRHVKAQ